MQTKSSNMRNLLTIVALTILAAACGDSYKDMISGKWQATEVLEGNKPMDNVNPEMINFYFDNDHHYTYQGTLKYKEAGTYYIQSKYLYTIDTVNQASTEKAVEIVKLTEDSLHIKMNDAGKEQIMKLVKVKE